MRKGLTRVVTTSIGSSTISIRHTITSVGKGAPESSKSLAEPPLERQRDTEPPSIAPVRFEFVRHPGKVSDQHILVSLSSDGRL